MQTDEKQSEQMIRNKVQELTDGQHIASVLRFFVRHVIWMRETYPNLCSLDYLWISACEKLLQLPQTSDTQQLLILNFLLRYFAPHSMQIVCDYLEHCDSGVLVRASRRVNTVAELKWSPRVKSILEHRMG